MEFEVFDSVTGDRLVAVIDHRGDGDKTPATWEELEAAAYNYGKLARCRLNNARVPPESVVNCLAEFKQDEEQ